MRFEDEVEGDAHVRRREAPLDRDVVPPEFAAEKPERHARLHPLLHRDALKAIFDLALESGVRISEK